MDGRPTVSGSGSHPSRGAWIEIARYVNASMGSMSRTPHGVRGLKSPDIVQDGVAYWSHPSRGAWIEINGGYRMSCTDSVAPLTGCVD